MNNLTIITIILLISFPANAYIDPGSISAITSAIIGIFVASGLVIKSYWYKIKDFFTKKISKEKDKAKNE